MLRSGVDSSICTPCTCHHTPSVLRTPSNIWDGVFLCKQLITLSRHLVTQKHSVLDVWRDSEYACVQTRPSNVLCHHNEHLMGYRIPTWLDYNLPSFKYFRKIALTTFFQRARRGRHSSPSALLMQYSIHPEENIYHSNKLGPPPFFDLDTSPILGQVLVHSVEKSHVLVVTVELIWLLFVNIFSFNFAPEPSKSFTLTRFNRDYVNHPAIVLIKVSLIFCLICTVQSGLFPFLTAVCPHLDNHIFVEHTCCSNAVNSKVDKPTKRCEIVIHKYIKTKISPA